MAIASFKKSVWETALMTAWRGISVADAITTPPTRIEGEKAIFNVVSGGTIKDYTGNVSYDGATTSVLSPQGHLERQAEFHASTQDEA